MDPSIGQSAAAAGNGGIPTPSSGNTPNTTASTPSESSAGDEQKQNLSQVIKSIDRTLQHLHVLNITLSSFNLGSQRSLLENVNNLVVELDTMQKLSEGCNFQIPMEVVNLIDDGKNPDEFTKDVFNSCVAKNQITKGKTDAFKSLRKHLLEELEQTFPDEVEAYREIRASSAAVTTVEDWRKATRRRVEDEATMVEDRVRAEDGSTSST